MAIVSNASVKDTHYSILNDYSLYESAIIGLKIAYSLSYQIQNDSLLFKFLLCYINELKNIDLNKIDLNLKHLTNIFIMNILTISGYRLDTKNCSSCNGQLDKGAFFNELNGHFYCQRCYLDAKNLISKQCLDYIQSPELYKLDNEVIEEVYILLKKCLKIYFNYEL